LIKEYKTFSFIYIFSDFIEHGYLKGKRKVATSIFSTDEGENEPKIQQNRTLMDAIIETVSKCSDEFDDGVQLQV
jgi:hypothetical protein